MRIAILAVLLGGLSSGSPVAAQDAVVASGWTIERMGVALAGEPFVCTMARSFEDGAISVDFMEKADGTRLMMAGKGWSEVPTQERDLTFAIDGRSISGKGAARGGYDLDTGKGFVIWLQPGTLDMLGKGSRFVVRRRDALVADLSLTGSAAGVAALRRCTAMAAVEFKTKMARRLGQRTADPFAAAPPTVAAAPVMRTALRLRNDPRLWITIDDYPPAARQARRTGTTGFALTVAETGLVSGCRITSSSGHDDLDAQTCFILPRRARFEPFTGEGAVKSYHSRIRWILP